LIAKKSAVIWSFEPRIERIPRIFSIGEIGGRELHLGLAPLFFADSRGFAVVPIHEKARANAPGLFHFKIEEGDQPLGITNVFPGGTVALFKPFAFLIAAVVVL